MIKAIAYPFIAVTLLVNKCNKNSNTTALPAPTEQTKTAQYTNPVFEPVLADPSVIKADDGYFYAFGTQDNWGDGKGSHLIAILRSKDLVNWTYQRDAFDIKPKWKEAGGLWAPDVVKAGNEYYLYYSYSIWADPNPGIGLATSPTPAGPYTDLGKLFFSSDINLSNTIDPFYIKDENKKYLFFGSYSNTARQGIHGTELTDDGKKVKDLNNTFKIAAGDFEGVIIYKKRNYYYFLGSKGGCCSGANSNYNVRVGRADNLRGPYLDKNGNDLTVRGNGTLLIEGNDIVAGPGHCARIITDDAGTDWFIYHGILKSNPKVPSGASRRTLMIDKISWVDGWPVINGNTPSVTQQQAPVFKKENY